MIVLEDGLVGSGETGRTTAHLANALDDRYTEIERIHGQESVQDIVQGQGAIMSGGLTKLAVYGDRQGPSSHTVCRLSSSEVYRR